VHRTIKDRQLQAKIAAMGAQRRGPSSPPVASRIVCACAMRVDCTAPATAVTWRSRLAQRLKSKCSFIPLEGTENKDREIEIKIVVEKAKHGGAYHHG
jgi:hypothetical protein